MPETLLHQKAPESLAALARLARVGALKMVHHAQIGQPAADMSAADILAVLYGGALRLHPGDLLFWDRDRMIASKSHCTGALYVLLAECGFFPREELLTYGRPMSRLGTTVSHRTPGVEFSTGALGHGLPFAVGAALAARIQKSSRRVFVLTGDGELQEGSNWEAIMLAASKRLSNLTLVVDRNRAQRDGSTEDINALDPLDEKFRSFNWHVRIVDGHDVDLLWNALTAPHGPSADAPDRPLCVIAETVKGKGVSFMENVPVWHSKRLSDEDLQRALAEIEGPPNEH